MSVRAEAGLALLLALGITVAVLAGGRSGAPAAAFEPASSFASGPTGGRAIYEVLQSLGLKVERRRSPLFDLDQGGAHRPALLMIIDPEPWDGLQSAELTQVAKFVRTGGALFLAGGTSGIAPCLGWARRGESSYHPDSFAVQPVSGLTLPPVTSFLQPRRDSLEPGERARCPSFGAVSAVDTVVRTLSGRPVFLDLRFREGGRVLLGADDDWLRNAAWKASAVPYVLVPLIRSAAGPRLIAFDEYHHGYAESGASTLAVVWVMGTPAAWVLLQLLAVALVALFVSAFRFGPARSVIDRRRRSPLEHLDALAAGLESSDGSQTALGLIVGGLRRRLSRTGQAPGAKAADQWMAALTLAMPTPQGRGAVRRLREAFTKPGGRERVLAAANSVEDVWEELRPRSTRDAFSKP